MTTTQRLRFVEVPPTGRTLSLCEAAYEGLSAPQKRLPSRFFYDTRGSELFERITALPEYYPTRTEQAILTRYAGEMLEAAGEDVAIAEFGSGSSAKTRTLLSAALERQSTLHYVPIDISAEFLRQSSEKLLGEYPGLAITAVAAEYFDAIAALPPSDGPRLILFLGSNVGNMTHTEAGQFLGRLRAALSPRDAILIGVDQVKDLETLELAYNDPAGVTAAFNKNVLRRINVELGGHFELDRFRHFAPYDARFDRIEMRLISTVAQTVRVDYLETDFAFAEGEFIHTEWSHKYTPASFGALAASAGLDLAETWNDPRGWFAVHLLRPGRP